MSQTIHWKEYQKEWEGLEAQELLRRIDARFGDQAVLSTSFGVEDQLLTHFIRSQKLRIGIFTLDTGRNFEETYYTMAMTMARYGAIDVFAPDHADVEALLREKGPASFYESVENRKECCHIRKVKPLARALAGKRCWIAGLRREHSQNRQERELVEWDEDHALLKVYPLLDWKHEELWAAIKSAQVPYNELHDRGFPSIGCAPCTRAIKPGEDFRAGRWWWEQADQECGLHVSPFKPQAKTT